VRVLGVIPARGGSKGVPRKNLRPVAGEPLVAYAIRAARDSRRLSAFLTTTDDDEIAEVAAGCGSPVLSRSADLAADDTPMVEVVLDALAHAEEEAGESYDAVVLLQPTSPIRTGQDIDSAIEILEGDPEAEAVISVVPTEDEHPGRMYRTDERGELGALWPAHETAQRQDLPVVYYRNGAIYAVRRSVLVEKRTVMGDRKRPYVMSRDRLANVDDERDLVVADAVMRWLSGRDR
jgi:CMP-N,N'-diacetyllegionaminic acid synthase